MRDKTRLVLFITFAALMLAGIACGGAPATAPAPKATTPAPSATALPPTATLPAPTVATVPPTVTSVPPSATPAQTGLDGDWKGKTSADLEFLFTVENNQVTYFNFSYYLKKGTCMASGGFGDAISVPVIDNKFTVQQSDASGKQVSFTGTFISDTEATGTLDLKIKSEICGDMSGQMSWSVLNESAIASGTIAALPPTQPAGQAGFDGKWEGKNSEDRQVSFTVENNQITFVVLNYSVNSGGCSLGGGMTNSPENAPIIDKSFTVEFKDNDGRLFTFAGSFTSDTEAAGTIRVKGTPSSFCGAFETEMPWTAQNTTVKGVATTSAPPTSAPPAVDPISIVDGFFNAINAKNMDAALAFVDDNLIFNFGSPTNIVGKANLKVYLTTQTALGITYTLTNYQAVGESLVKFSARASDGAVYAASQAILASGKIQILMLK